MGILSWDCGVSMPRQPQRHANIQDVALLELPLSAADLTSSRWATKGWIYQEGCLSRRRLVFTKTQVLFLCNRVYSAESLQKLLRNTYFTDRTRQFHHLIPQFAPTGECKFHVRKLKEMINEYSKRELTRSTDSLNAIVGVLNYYARSSSWGSRAVLILPWGLIAGRIYREKGFLLRILWYHRELPSRRNGFPTWSWLGWGAPLEFEAGMMVRPEQTGEEGALSYLDWQLSMRHDDGKISKMYDPACKAFEAAKSKHRPRV